MSQNEISTPQRISDTDARIARTRSQVLSAARRLHQEFGAEAVTHVRVAEESGVGRTTIYRHWPDTTSLLIDALSSDTTAISLRVAENESPRDRARALLEYVGDRLTSDAAPALLTLMERSEHDDRYREQLSTFANNSLQFLRAALAACGLDDAQADTASIQLLGSLFACRFLINRNITAQLIDELLSAAIDAKSKPEI